jgi:hypothetical protein
MVELAQPMGRVIFDDGLMTTVEDRQHGQLTACIITRNGLQHIGSVVAVMLQQGAGDTDAVALLRQQRRVAVHEIQVHVKGVSDGVPDLSGDKLHGHTTFGKQTAMSMGLLRILHSHKLAIGRSNVTLNQFVHARLVGVGAESPSLPVGQDVLQSPDRKLLAQNDVGHFGSVMIQSNSIFSLYWLFALY